MESPEAVSQRPHYQRCGLTTCNRDEDERWFILSVKLHGKTLSITVSADEFQNSPKRLDEFNQYLEMLQLDSEGEWPSDDEEEDDDDDDNVHGGGESPAHRPTLDLSLDGCYEWAITPFLPSLDKIITRPSDGATITLQHFFSGESFDANLRAVDDTLLPGVIQASDDMENVVGNPGILWKTTCPIFATREVEVLSDDPTYILVAEPTRVRVKGKELFFKAFMNPDDSVGAQEVLTLEKIFKARFNQQEVRTSRLYGIVEDEKSQIVGLLLHYIQVDDTLHDKVIDLGTSGSDLKDKWKRQVTNTVKALHRAGIVWGDVKAGNVLVDTAGDAWVTDFGGGHTRGWVDRDKAGTIEGDLQGLRAIIEFVDTGIEPEIMD